MWYYEEREFVEYPEEYYGFVYLIENLTSGKKYIGRKYFTSASSRIVKGKRKRTRIESDWKSYYGSSKELLEEISLNSKENYKRTILRLCKNRSECSYFETKEIFQRDALLDSSYYNSWVSCKIHSKHINK